MRELWLDRTRIADARPRGLGVIRAGKAHEARVAIWRAAKDMAALTAAGIELTLDGVRLRRKV